MSIAHQYGLIGKPVTRHAEPVTKPVTKPTSVTKPKGGRPPKGDMPMTGAERVAAYRQRKKS